MTKSHDLGKISTNQLPGIIHFYIISHDTGIANQDLKGLEAAMEDKDTWRDIV